MLNLITLQDRLDDLLSKYSGLLEIYAPLEYQLGDEDVTFHVLHRDDRYDFSLYKRINDIMCCKLIFITDAMDMQLQGKRIIWRKGKWYV